MTTYQERIRELTAEITKLKQLLTQENKLAHEFRAERDKAESEKAELEKEKQKYANALDSSQKNGTGVGSNVRLPTSAPDKRGIGERKGVIPFKDTPFGSYLIKAVTELNPLGCNWTWKHFRIEVLELLKGDGK